MKCRRGNRQNDVERGQEGESRILSLLCLCADFRLIVARSAIRPSPACDTERGTSRNQCASRTSEGGDLMVQQYGVKGTNSRTLPPEERQDFDDSAYGLWSLYGKEAESHDKARIETLKDDMDGVLIFVCARFFWSTGVDVTPTPGWLVLWCSHRIRRATDSEFESKSCRPVGLLPESIRPDAGSNIPTTRLSRQPDSNEFYSPAALPDLSCIVI